MCWVEKTGGAENLFIFLDDWKTREQIKDNFDLSLTESWHAVKWLSKMNRQILVKKNVGSTKRATLYKCREETLKSFLLPDD